MSKIQPVFDQFAVVVESGTVLFNTEAEAAAALSAFENGAEQRALAAAYCASKEITGKDAVTKTNVIVAFLQFQDSQSAVEETTEE